MTKYYSKTAKGFFDDSIHQILPSDALEISDQDHEILMDGQSQGLVINFNVSGVPQLVDPISLIPLSDVKEKRKQFINSERVRVLSEGMEFNNVLYDCDEEAKTNVTGIVAAIIAGIPLPDNFIWRSKDNQNVSMTSQDVLSLGAAIMGYRNSIMQKSWSLKDYIDTRTTKIKVAQIDWSTEL